MTFAEIHAKLLPEVFGAEVLSSTSKPRCKMCPLLSRRYCKATTFRKL